MTTTTAQPTSTLRYKDGNWIVGTVGPFEVQAKAFAEPSQYGMPEDQRISILWIALPGRPRTVIYGYDRGDFLTSDFGGKGLATIVAAIAKVIR